MKKFIQSRFFYLFDNIRNSRSSGNWADLNYVISSQAHAGTHSFSFVTLIYNSESIATVRSISFRTWFLNSQFNFILKIKFPDQVVFRGLKILWS